MEVNKQNYLTINKRPNRRNPAIHFGLPFLYDFGFIMILRSQLPSLIITCSTVILPTMIVRMITTLINRCYEATN